MKSRLYRTDTDLIAASLIAKDSSTFLHDPENRCSYLRPSSQNTDSAGVKVLVNTSSLIKREIDNPKYFDAVIDFSRSELGSILGSDYTVKEFNFINNPDGSMRWIFPADLDSPTFLNLYNSASTKAKIYAYLQKKTFNTPLRRIFNSGCFRVYYKGALRLEEITRSLDYDNFSMFTGTVGENRKVVFELNSGGKTNYYVKLPVSKVSRELVRNESKAIKTLKQLNLQSFDFPEIFGNDDAVVLSNIKPEDTVLQSDWTNKHIAVLEEVFSKTAKWSKLSDTSCYKISLVNIESLKNADRFDNSWNIYRSLIAIAESIPSGRFIPLSLCHADFTPWNMFTSEDKLHIYDWELSRNSMPMFFDMFHYIFQSGVLLQKKSYREIKSAIIEALLVPTCKEMIKRYNVDVKLHLKLYLLSVVSYYMHLYENQPDLHKQVYWLLEVWEEALKDLLPSARKKTQREEFIVDFTSRLNNTSYAFLKFFDTSLEEIPAHSDLDIVVLKDDITAMLNFAEKHPFVDKVNSCKKSFMTTLEIFFKDGSFLALDLISDFRRKSLQFMNSKEILLNARPNKHGIRIPDLFHDLEYIYLFYTLNNADIPEKYKQVFESLPQFVLRKLINKIAYKYAIEISSIEDLVNFSAENKQRIQLSLTSRKQNDKFSVVRNTFHYIKDTVKESLLRKGFVITFSGVDGAGKSTMIQNIADNVSSGLRRKTKVLRHRPSIFPILSAYKYGMEEAEKKSMSVAPRQGTNSNFALSLLRFSYYYTDYVIGQLIVFFRYILRGYVVIYDRYYFDFINDAKRSNIQLPKWITKALYLFIHKPRLNVFLYASPEVILSRKQELDSNTITKLTHDFQLLFSHYNLKYKKSDYLQIENLDIVRTEKRIMKAIFQAA